MWFERIVMICHPHVALAKSAVQWSDILSEVARFHITFPKMYTLHWYTNVSQILMEKEIHKNKRMHL